MAKNCFTGKRTNKISAVIGRLVVGLMLVFFIVYGANFIKMAAIQEEKQALEQRLMNSLAHYYATQGFYPQNLPELLSQYEIEYDQRAFFVDYTVVASNLLPQITVIIKK